MNTKHRTRRVALAAAAILVVPIAAQTTTRISLYGTAQSTRASFSPDITPDGQKAAYVMSTPTSAGLAHVWVHDIATGSSTDVTPGDQIHAIMPNLSDDGQWVVYSSPNDLVAGMSLSGATKLYLENLATGTIELLSRKPNGDTTGGHYGRLSSDMRYVVFESGNGDLTSDPVPSGTWQIYVRDRQTATNTLISRAIGGGGGNRSSLFADLSADGRFVVFQSEATDLVAGVPSAKVYARDRDPDGNGVFDEGNGVTRLLSRNAAGQPGNIGSFSPSTSDDGRFVAYYTSSTNLVAGDTNGAFDVIVLDRDFDQNGTFDDSPAHNVRASVDSLGNEAWSTPATQPKISGDGARVIFVSARLVQNVTLVPHVYMHDLRTRQTTCVSVSSDYEFGDAQSGYSPNYRPFLAIDRDGDRVLFVSDATNLIAGDTNQLRDTFLHEVCPNPALEMGSWLAGTGGVAPDFTVCGTTDSAGLAVLRLRRALPNTAVALVVSDQAGSFPLFGGTLIPSPPWVAVALIVDANGSFDGPVTIGGGPFSLFAQWVAFDPGAVEGISMSNALEILVQR